MLHWRFNNPMSDDALIFLSSQSEHISTYPQSSGLSLLLNLCTFLPIFSHPDFLFFSICAHIYLSSVIRTFSSSQSVYISTHPQSSGLSLFFNLCTFLPIFGHPDFLFCSICAHICLSSVIRTFLLNLCTFLPILSYWDFTFSSSWFICKCFFFNSRLMKKHFVSANFTTKKHFVWVLISRSILWEC